MLWHSWHNTTTATEKLSRRKNKPRVYEFLIIWWSLKSPDRKYTHTHCITSGILCLIVMMIMMPAAMERRRKGDELFFPPTHKICLRPHKEKRYLSIVWMRHSWSFRVNFIQCSYDIQKSGRRLYFLKLLLLKSMIGHKENYPSASVVVVVHCPIMLWNFLYSMSMHVCDDKLWVCLLPSCKLLLFPCLLSYHVCSLLHYWYIHIN